MTIRHELAGLAGGTLGFIHDNTRGAIKGYYLGKQLSKSMAPIPKKRRNSYSTPSTRGTITNGILSRRSSNPFDRRLSDVSMRSAKGTYRAFTGRGTGSASASGYRSISGNPAAIKKRKRKGVVLKKKRRVKVSGKFKRKVHKALDEKIYGKHLKVHYDRLPATGSYQQSIKDFGHLFTPLRMIAAADVLFNKAPVVEFPATTDIKWNNSFIRQDYVINSWASFELKNCSQRTYTIKMYECKPLNKAVLPVTNDAYADWIRGMLAMQGLQTNPASNTPNTLYSVPFDSPQFNQCWKAEVTTCILEPGQSNTFFVQGPNQQSIDWQKYVYENSGFVDVMNEFATWSRDVFFVYYEDLVTTDGNNVGRIVSGPVTGGGGVAIEFKEFFKLEVPASAGFTYPASTAAGVKQQLDNKLPTKIISVFPQIVVGNVVDVAEENPAVSTNPYD
ncbi:putative capsid protein [Sewage-associated circular DNA virus-27]|uniref:Putative capsid protein n=1 Tax=Sewage-associated circular DNA virus-27 TaxID=1592094 RepID=A0A0B4UFY7_9VIRU|nr:putative capsid protein [Sewage-associated circular DNA virus-27]AJD07547.1 putative capsid protein [Sewage-associated circular DNA virus-27]